MTRGRSGLKWLMGGLDWVPSGARVGCPADSPLCKRGTLWLGWLQLAC